MIVGMDSAAYEQFASISSYSITNYTWIYSNGSGFGSSVEQKEKKFPEKSSRANKCESKDVHHDFDRVITKLTDDVEFVEEVCQHNSLNKKGAGRKLQGQADPQYRRTKGVGCPLSYR